MSSPLELIRSPSSLQRSIMPNSNSINWNQTVTEQALNMIPKLGTGAYTCAPRVGYDKSNPSIPRWSLAQQAGNLLGTKSATGNGVRGKIGAAIKDSLALSMPYSDGVIELEWGDKAKLMESFTEIKIDQWLARLAANTIMNTEEADFVATCWVLANWFTQYASGAVTKWNNAASSPKTQINTAVNAVIQACGQTPNAAVCAKSVADALTVHPEVLEAMGGGHGSDKDQKVSYEAVRIYLGLEKLTVANRVKNNAVDLTEANISLGFSITDGLLLFVDNGDQLEEGSALCRAHYNLLGAGSNGSTEGIIIDMDSDRRNRLDYRNICRQAGFNIIDNKAGAFFEDLV